MRLHLLDKLICPQCGHFPLSIGIDSEEGGLAPIAQIQPCELYCALETEWLEKASAEPPCTSCMKRRVWSGVVECLECESHYPIDEGIPDLLIGEELDEWVAEEQIWWDMRYAKIAGQVNARRVEKPPKGIEVPGNCYYERNVHLFAPLRQRDISGLLMLEIGAGTSEYVSSMLWQSAGRFLYIGTDVSREALTIGSRLLPEGDFVQCHAGSMPFREGIADVLLSLGVLHHIPRWQISLDRIVDLLKPGGWMLFDEAVEKPRLLGRLRQRSFTADVDSPHEGEIRLEQLLNILSKRGHLLLCHRKNTPLRVVLVWMFDRLMEKSLIVTKAILSIDQLFMKSAGSLFKSLGPGEALGIFEKV